MSVLLWVDVTLAMGITFQLSTSFGNTYGSLAGIVPLQMWALLSSLGIMFGGAVAAQLEAMRAGVPGPQRERLAADEAGPADDEMLAVDREPMVVAGIN